MANSSSATGQDAKILLVEDNPGDVRLIEEAFQDASISNRLYRVADGVEALDFVNQRDDYEDVPRPNLILLDWNLPRTSGEEVLEEIKCDPELSHIPVIVLTGSAAQEDIITSYNNHANAYVTKPVDTDAFLQVVRSLEAFWLSVVHFPPHTDGE